MPEKHSTCGLDGIRCRSDAGRVQCCVITPRGEGGIGVILLRGDGAADVLDSCFLGTRRRAVQIPPGRTAHGRIVLDGAIVDEVIVAHYPLVSGPVAGPCYEVNCHGGAIAVRTVLECLQKGGAELSSWRELMRGDADLSGLPLSREAIRLSALEMLPGAVTGRVAGMLLHQAAGALSGELRRIADDLAGGVRDGAERLRKLARSARGGLAMTGPEKVMLAGPPNAGKSTLLNAMLQRERVIVHPAPGTTRDVVKDRLSIDGMPFYLMDSAGIRLGDDAVEKAAVEQTLERLREADTVLFVFDIREDFSQVLRAASSLLPQGRRVLFVANKCDLQQAPAPPQRGESDRSEWMAAVSARERRGLEAISGFLLKPYGDIIQRCESGGAVVFTRQQRVIVDEALRLTQSGKPDEAATLLRESGAAR